MNEDEIIGQSYLEEATRLVGSGNLSAAAWEYRRVMGTQYVPLSQQTRDAWITLSEGDFAAALTAFRYLAAEPIPDRNILMTAAILERSYGDTYVGHPLLMKAFELWPNDAGLAHQIGQSYVIQDNRHQAVSFQERSVQLAPENTEYLYSLLGLKNILGDYTGALKYYPNALCVADPQLRHWMLGRIGHARIAAGVDREALSASLLAQENAPTWSSTEQVWARLREAIVQRRPCSLIRLGDGEGRFLFRDDPDSAYSDSDRAEFSDTAFINWFGRDSSHFSLEERLDLRQRVAGSIATADLLGLPMQSRVSVDLQHLGYLWALQAHLDAQPDLRHSTKAGCFVNIDLHKLDPFYERLLHGCESVFVVSCHRDLGPHLSRQLGTVVGSVLVAGEQCQPNIPATAREGRHYPEQYWSTLAKIADAPAGTVWLVAAGLLGKVYCDEAKRHGGIAIDIGSLADAWMGFNTRAGHYEDLDRYVLAAV